MPSTPTVVIGLGEAGCRMAAAVNELATEEGIADRVEILAIDSRPEDIDQALPNVENGNRTVLPHPAARLSSDREQRPYLGEETELAPSGGATRQRPVGRYFVDNPEGLEGTWAFLEGHIEEFVADAPSTEQVDIWIVNSLAGGTGSGAFLLVAGLVNEILADLEAERDVTTTLRGVGSLLRLDRLVEQVRAPEGPIRLYTNAYTALRELRTVLDEETARISLHPEAEQFARDDLNVGGVFDQYLLVGVSDQERTHLNALNETVADAIYYLGTVADTDGFLDDSDVHDARLFSLDGGELAFPIEAVERYIESGKTIDTIREEIDELERERRRLTEDQTYLEAVLSLARDELPSSDSPVDRTLVNHCEREAADIAPRRMGPEELDDRVDTVVADLQGRDFVSPTDRAFDPSAVVRYLLLGRLLTAVERERNRARRELEDFVTMLLDTYREAVRRYLDDGDIERLESDPLTAADGLEGFLEAEHARLVERREESLNVFVDVFYDLRTRIEEMERLRDELRFHRSEYDHRQALLDEVRPAFEESRDTLRDQRTDIEERRHELDDRIAERERTLEMEHERRESVVEWAGKSHTSRRQRALPIEQPESIIAGILERAEEGGFPALVKAGLVEHESIETGFEQACLDLREPIQDIPTTPPPTGVLAPILADENAEEWMDVVRSAASANGFDHVGVRVDTADTLSVRLLGLYAGVDLDATSEFGALHEYYTGSDRELRELFGSDAEQLVEFAYPELQ